MHSFTATTSQAELNDLRDRLRRTRFVKHPSASDWAYCARTNELEWHKMLGIHERDLVERPEEIVSAVEFVWYENGAEHSESIALTG